MAGYVTAVPAFVCGKLPVWVASSFRDFLQAIFFLDMPNKDNYR